MCKLDQSRAREEAVGIRSGGGMELKPENLRRGEACLLHVHKRPCVGYPPLPHGRGSDHIARFS
ncbi:MAG: hypothetical protein MI923_29040 [Phycisphaerales bacterium]|nr:hypothetical protein [Phycisphaerales bacterium]